MKSILHERKEIDNTFGDRLRTRRKELNLSQEAVGVLIGLDESCSRARISRYEAGIHEPSINTAQKLAATLMAPTAYFYCERDALADLILKVNSLSDVEIYNISKDLI